MSSTSEEEFWEEFKLRQGEGRTWQIAQKIRLGIGSVAPKTHVGGHPYTTEGTKAFGYYLRPIMPQPIGKGLRTIAIWTTAEIEIQFEYLQPTASSNKEEVQDKLYKAVTSISNLDIPVGRKRGRPSFAISNFANEEAVDQFINVISEYILAKNK